MRAAIRQKINAALAVQQGRLSHLTPDNFHLLETIANRVVGGEKLYTLKEVAERCNMHPTTALRALKGRPGFLQLAERGKISITESLLKAFIAEAAARGLSGN